MKTRWNQQRLQGVRPITSPIKRAERVATIATTQAFKVYYSKVPQGDSYTMSHSGLLYVMNPEGKLVAFFNHEDTAEKLAVGLRQVLENKGARS